MLIATCSVLYRSKIYGAGDALPADNQSMVDAWLEAGSAVWQDDEGKPAAKKAKRASTPSGVTGISSDGDKEALVGHVSDKPQRKTTKKGSKK